MEKGKYLRGFFTKDGVYLPFGSVISADTKNMTVTDEHNRTYKVSKEEMGMYFRSQCYVNPIPDEVNELIETLKDVE